MTPAEALKICWPFTPRLRTATVEVELCTVNAWQIFEAEVEFHQYSDATCVLIQVTIIHENDKLMIDHILTPDMRAALLEQAEQKAKLEDEIGD